MRTEILALLVLGFVIVAYSAEQAATPDFPKAFHLVGIPEMRRDERVDIQLAADGLLFQRKKVEHRVLYRRIRQVLFLQAHRAYEGRTYAAALATFGAGGFLILKKHHVDTVAIEYENERGGQMGIVVQLEQRHGARLKTLLTERGVRVIEPESPPSGDPKQQQ